MFYLDAEFILLFFKIGVDYSSDEVAGKVGVGGEICYF